MNANGPMTRSNKVATLEEAKAQFRKSWDGLECLGETGRDLLGHHGERGAWLSATLYVRIRLPRVREFKRAARAISLRARPSILARRAGGEFSMMLSMFFMFLARNKGRVLRA